MKRILALMLVFATLAFVTACGDSEKTESEAESLADYGIGDIAAAAGIDRGVIYSSLAEEQKTALESAAAAQGAAVEFGAEGETVFTFSDDGGVVTQYADGKISFTTQGAEDNAATVNDTWPENDYTAKLPVPSFSVGSSSEMNGSFTVFFTDADKAGVVAYGEALAAAGFSADAETKETGDSYYSYEAANGDGDRVKLSFSGAVATVKITLGK